jgi:hypothetical protein
LLAAAGGHVEVCEALLLHGVDVSAADDVSSMACFSFYPAIFERSETKCMLTIIDKRIDRSNDAARSVSETESWEDRERTAEREIRYTPNPNFSIITTLIATLDYCNLLSFAKKEEITGIYMRALERKNRVDFVF